MAYNKNNYKVEIEEDLQQSWSRSTNGKNHYYYDQYGFNIYLKDSFGRYKVRWKGKTVAEVYSLVAAKRIANILINDIVMFKEKGMTEEHEFEPNPSLLLKATA